MARTHTHARFAVAMDTSGFTGKAVLNQSNYLAAPGSTILVEGLWVMLRHSARCSISQEESLATSLNFPSVLEQWPLLVIRIAHSVRGHGHNLIRATLTLAIKKGEKNL